MVADRPKPATRRRATALRNALPRKPACLGSRFGGDETRFSRILCLGAHCDDIEIGCGGTILRCWRNIAARVHWVVFSVEPVRKEATQLPRVSEVQPIAQWRFRISAIAFFPYEGKAIKEFVAAIRKVFDRT